MPLPYRQQILRVPSVSAVSWANWFGGVYGDPNDFKNFWPRLAVDPETYFDLYPEFQLPPDQLAAFRKERNACVIGRKLAAQHGFKIGDCARRQPFEHNRVTVSRAAATHGCPQS